MNIYSKETDSERYVSFKSNQAKHSLKNNPFSLTRRIFMITGKDSLKVIKLKELETLLLEQHYAERIKSRYEHNFKNTPKRIKKWKRTRKKRRFYILIQLLIKTTPKPCQLLNKPWKT